MNVRAAVASSQAERFPLDDAGEGDGGSPMLRMLRTAIDETGWKHTAIAAAIDVDPKYLSRMLSGEKPWTLRHLNALPDDVERHYARLYAEHFGLIVIERVDDATASRHLASGLFNLLRADRMAKAFPAPTMAKVNLK